MFFSSRFLRTAAQDLVLEGFSEPPRTVFLSKVPQNHLQLLSPRWLIKTTTYFFSLSVVFQNRYRGFSLWWFLGTTSDYFFLDGVSKP